MPAIITNNFSVINTENFISSFINGDSNLYIAVGQGFSDSATDADATAGKYDDFERWDDESIPPTPQDTIAQQKNFINHMIGMKRVLISNIMIMVPRVEWAAGMKFSAIDESAVAGKRATNYYCLTSNNEVWQCVGNTGTNETTMVGCEPVLSSSVAYNSAYDGFTYQTADGFIWKFLYNIKAYMVNGGMLLDNWMPVPSNKHGVYPGGTITDTQALYGDKQANRTLGAYRVLVTVTLKDEGDKIPYSSIYRQVALIVDPTDADGNRLTADTYGASEVLVSKPIGQADGSTSTETVLYGGEIIYLENKKPVMREESMRETLELLLVF